MLSAPPSRARRSRRAAGVVAFRPLQAPLSASISMLRVSPPTRQRATSMRRPPSCATLLTPPAPLPSSPVSASVATAAGATTRPTGRRRAVEGGAGAAASVVIATVTAPRTMRATRGAASSRARRRCFCPLRASSTSPTISTPTCAPPAIFPAPRTSTSLPIRSRTTVCVRATPSRAGSARAARPPTPAARGATTAARIARPVRSTTRWSASRPSTGWIPSAPSGVRSSPSSPLSTPRSSSVWRPRPRP